MSITLEHKATRRLGFATLLLIALVFLSPFYGASSFSSLSTIFNGNVDDLEVLFRLRIPRILLAALAGAGLGIAGLTFQTLFRNSLASPYTLGVASGASFGAVSCLSLGLSTSGLWGFLKAVPAASIGALLGSAVVSLALMLIARRAEHLRGSTLLLAGVALSFFFSSLTLLAQYLGEERDAFQILRWLMGGVAVVDLNRPLLLLPVVIACLFVVWAYRKELDAISSGEELAYGFGINVLQVRTRLLCVLCLLVGAIVSFCGPIGFVGIIIPHVSRLLVGRRHRDLIPMTILCSASFLILCDLFARVFARPAEIPIGIITALLGGPCFLYLLLNDKN